MNNTILIIVLCFYISKVIDYEKQRKQYLYIFNIIIIIIIHNIKSEVIHNL